MKKAALAVLVAIIAFPLVLVLTVAMTAGEQPPASSDPCDQVAVGADGAITKPIGVYSVAQLKVAVLIINEGKRYPVPLHGQIVAVMTAIGESGMDPANFGHGDLAGPDSRGPFQQRDLPEWGSLADRMNPTTAARAFYRTLLKVPGWEQLEPTIAAHKVQRNQDPFHYRKFEADARMLVAKLADVKVSDDCGPGGPMGKGDDYPWPSQQLNTATSLGMYARECVDFALWRMNQQAGVTKEPWKYTNFNFRGDGQRLGSALTWLDGWQAKGWPTGDKPRVGAVVWYAPGAGGAGDLGHVAIVKALGKDGTTFVEEGYNGKLPPNDHTYYTRTVAVGAVSRFLYLPNNMNPKEKP